MKKFWLDLETTGLSSYNNHIVEIGGIFEDTDKPDMPPVEFHQYIYYVESDYPKDYESGAGRVNGLTKQKLKEIGCTPDVVWNALIAFLDGYIDKYDPKDKALVLGYNVGFDEGFFRKFMELLNETKYKLYGTYFMKASLDVKTSYMMGVEQGVLLPLPNYKLVTVAESFSIKFDAHSAIEDIKATKRVYERVMDKLIDHRSGTVPA